MNRYLRILLFAALFVAFFCAVTPRAEAQGSDPVKLRIEVTDSGFNPNTVEVPQGSMVELTFVWNQPGNPNDEHIMVVEGYKLESDKINQGHRETTLKFVADKPGDFVFRCDLDCDKHDLLQAGHLKVSASGGKGGSASLTATKISVSPSSWVTAGDPIILMATLKDDQGKPVSKAEVSFSIQAQFGPTTGQMDIGSAKTDVNGVAFLPYKPTLHALLQTITAQFDGMGVYAQSKQSIQIRLIGTPPSAYTVDPTGLPDAPAYASLAPATVAPISTPLVAALSWSMSHWQETPIVLLVGGVWLAFAYVLFQAFGIAWVGKRG